MNIRFAVQSYKHDSLPLSSQRCVNAYAEAQPKDAKTPVAVFGPAGISTYGTIGSGPIRGCLEMNGIAYFVSGNKFYSIDDTGAGTLLGVGITGSGMVSLDGNGFEIVIVNGVFGYSYLVSDGTFVQISDADFEPANTVTVINNIFAFDQLGTNKFTISNLLDGRTYDADFASAESNPDFVKVVKNRNGVLLVFGAKTIEPWDHTGGTDFPFLRFKSNTADRGIAGPLALVLENQSVYFLGEDIVFYILSGMSITRISTHALEREWRAYGTTSDAICFLIAVDGHKFVYLTFISESKTFAYDIATSLWHERTSYDPAGIEVKWRVCCSLNAYNKTLVGDFNSNKIGLLDPKVYTEFGDPIITTLISPPTYAAGQRIFSPCFEADMEMGVGALSGQGEDPQVMMSYSTNGHDYSTPAMWSTLGRQGVYDRMKLKWDRLGSAIQFTFKLVISDPVKRVLYSARCPGMTVGEQ